VTLTAAIDWTAKYAALYDWASGASGWTTVWADQDVPRPAYPYIMLDVTSSRKEGGVDEITHTVDFTRARDIKATPIASNNQLYEIAINGTPFQYTSDADATVAEITAGLHAAIAAGAEPVDSTDNGTDLDIVGQGETLNPGTPRLFNVVMSGPISWKNNDAGNEMAVRASASVEFTLNVQGFERNTLTDYAATDPGRNAYNMLSTLRASLGLPSVQAALRAADIALIEELSITDLSEPVEEAILSRASMDIRMRTLSVLTEYVGYISSVAGASQYAGSKDSPINDTYAVNS